MQLFALSLAAQVCKHRPVNVPVELDVQAVRLETARPVEIGQVELAECGNLLRAEIHVAQGMLVILRQAADGIQHHGHHQFGFLGSGGRRHCQSPSPAFVAAWCNAR